MAHQAFRFGVTFSMAGSAAEWLGWARRAEALGYDIAVMRDHFGGQFAPFSALAAMAMVTSRLRVGTLVLGNDFRHPVVVAKEAATLDVLTRGRFELGIGAGWMHADYHRAGLAYQPAPVRLDRLEEAVGLIRRSWAPGTFSRAGGHYPVADLHGWPRPWSRSGPPILIGGGGRRVLRIAAEHADIIGVHPRLGHGQRGLGRMGADGTEAAFKQKAGYLRDLLGAAFYRVPMSCLVYAVRVGRDTSAAVAEVGNLLGLPADEVRRSPLALVGTVGDLAGELERRRERLGLSYVVVRRRDMERFAPVMERLSAR